MKTAGNLFLTFGAALGVWVITNAGDAGITDIAIVVLLVVVGATLKNAKKPKGGD